MSIHRRPFDKHVNVISVGKKTNAVKPLTRTVVNLSKNTYQENAQFASKKVHSVSPSHQITFIKQTEQENVSEDVDNQGTEEIVTQESKDLVSVLELKQHCKNLEEELDQVKVQIVKIVADKNDFIKENAVLRTYQNAFVALNEQNEILRRKVTELSLKGVTFEDQNETVKINVKMAADGEIRSYGPDIARSSPDGQEKDIDTTPSYTGTTAELEISSLKEKIANLQHDVEENVKMKEEEKSQLLNNNRLVKTTLCLFSQGRIIGN